MTEIVLVRQDRDVEASADREAARRFLLDHIDGMGELMRKRWRRFLGGLLRMAPGEIATIKTRRTRSGPFHRRHMKIETRVFESQERIEDFESFRYWLKVGAGFVTWMPGPKGGVIPVPKSIAYDKLEDDEMREFHDAAMRFLRTPMAAKYLWPKLPDAQREAAMDLLLQEFDE